MASSEEKRTGPPTKRQRINKTRGGMPNPQIPGNDELRIVMIGETGTGKSELGNAILMNENAFVADVTGDSVTKICKLRKENVLGTTISIVDTPGLFDTSTENETIIMEITRCVWMTAPGPHAIILTIQIGRQSLQVQNTIREFQKFFGPNVTKYMIVVFTFKDLLKSKRGTKTIEEYVSTTVPVVKDILQKCGMRYIAFNNLSEDKDECENQVRSLIKMIREMVKKNGGGQYTNSMLEEAEKKIRERTEQIEAELEQQRLAEAEEIRRNYEGEVRDENLEKLNDKIDQIDARQKAISEAGELTWGNFFNALVAVSNLYMSYKQSSGGVETEKLAELIISMIQNASAARGGT